MSTDEIKLQLMLKIMDKYFPNADNSDGKLADDIANFFNKIYTTIE